ncbi:MAG: CatB-related O-acetyltransferase [Muribaculaceae bacterium]|nr:CatB-related O-acetyltransferase [Muribaculaceae bacterium]
MRKLIKYLYLRFIKRIGIKFYYSTIIGRSSIFEGKGVIGRKSVFNGVMGYGTYISANSKIYGKIGRFCSIAGDVTVVVGVHPIKNKFVSTSPIFYSTIGQTGEIWVSENKFEELRFAEDKFPIVIGNDVWIGYGANILSGVKINDGAVVLAGSVVTKDVPPYTIVGGVPAKVIDTRYDEETIKWLLNFKWWERPIDWIKDNVNLFQNIDDLKKFSKI